MSDREDAGPESSESVYLRTAFLERLAHELRGPAGVILGALDEIENALGEEAKPHASLFAMARRGVRRIARSADRLQQTGVLERGAMELSRESCDLPALLRRSIEDARNLENRRNIEIDIRTPSQPLMSNLDSRWMGVVFYELASNTIRHASKRAEVALLDEPTGITVVFIDDNPANHAFEPMRFRSTRETRGLGLALAIVRDVVNAHGGQLEIARRDPTGVTHGAEVRLRIPRDERTMPS